VRKPLSSSVYASFLTLDLVVQAVFRYDLTLLFGGSDRCCSRPDTVVTTTNGPTQSVNGTLQPAGHSSHHRSTAIMGQFQFHL
jgi:hypothetical protein